jgi:membrane-associated phospholipid phosphatase
MASTWFHRLPHVFNGFGPVLHGHPLPFHGTPLFYIFKFGGDAVAAFPSEHAAFPLLECLAFFCVSRKVGGLMVLYVLAVLFVIVYLGEHWITDALAGYLYAVVIFSGVRWFAVWRGRERTVRVAA